MSSTSCKKRRYCLPCRRRRANIYTQRLINNGGSHTVGEWRQKLAQYDSCPRCNRLWSEIPPRSDRRYKNVWTKDHIKRVEKGGSDDINNIQPLCYRCNSSKCNGRGPL
ncbi:MAG: HNH endonuclease [Akkermansiaceae bacterium]|nr:HNH endonuclease [Armatimonadota bacterium]